MTFDKTVESVLKRDRVVIVAAVGVLTVMAWFYLISFAGNLNEMDNMSMDMAGMSDLMPWTIEDALATFIMWSVMMFGMMLPSATPVILLYALVYRKRANGGQPLAPTGAFFLGYITVWVAFSAMATALQWSFEQLALLSPMLVSTSSVLNGVILIVAGVYQWLPTKRNCLRHCRSPVDFISKHWRTGTAGVFTMGIRHGLYCLGCCWALMLLLFVSGVMNLLWLAAIAILVLVEKIAPFGQLVGLAGSVLLIAAGMASIVL